MHDYPYRKETLHSVLDGVKFTFQAFSGSNYIYFRYDMKYCDFNFADFKLPGNTKVINK